MVLRAGDEVLAVAERSSGDDADYPGWTVRVLLPSRGKVRAFFRLLTSPWVDPDLGDPIVPTGGGK